MKFGHNKFLEKNIAMASYAGAATVPASNLGPHILHEPPEKLEFLVKLRRQILSESDVGSIDATGSWTNRDRYVRTVVNCLHRAAASYAVRLHKPYPKNLPKTIDSAYQYLLDSVLFKDEPKSKVLGESGDDAVGEGGCCGYIFKAGDFTFHCVDCSADDTCVMCASCFDKSDHTGHQVKFFTSHETGGYCDCGDPEAIAPSGFCSDHRASHQDSVDSSSTDESNPADLPTPRLRKLFEPTLEAVCDFIHEVLLFKGAVSHDDQTLEDFVKFHQPDQAEAAQFCPEQQEANALRNIFHLVAHHDESTSKSDLERVFPQCRKSFKRWHDIAFCTLEAVSPKRDLESLLSVRRIAQARFPNTIHRKFGLHLSVVSEEYQRDAFFVFLALRWLADLGDWGAAFAATLSKVLSSPRAIPPFYERHLPNAVPRTLLDCLLTFYPLIEDDLNRAANLLLLRRVTKDYSLKLATALAMSRSYRIIMNHYTHGLGLEDNDTIATLNVNMVTVPSILEQLCGSHTQTTVSPGSAPMLPPDTKSPNFLATCLRSLNYMLSSCYSRAGKQGITYLSLDTPIFDDSRFSRPLQDLKYALDCSNGLFLFVQTSLRAYAKQFPHPETAPCFYLHPCELISVPQKSVDVQQFLTSAKGAYHTAKQRKLNYFHKLSGEILRELCSQIGMDTSSAPFNKNPATLKILALHAHDFLHLPDRDWDFHSPLHLFLQALALVDGVDFAKVRSIFSVENFDINLERFIRSFNLAEYVRRCSNQLVHAFRKVACGQQMASTSTVTPAEAKECARIALDFFMAFRRPSGGEEPFDSECQVFRAATILPSLAEAKIGNISALQTKVNDALPHIDKRGRRSFHGFLHRFVVDLCVASGLMKDLAEEAAAEKAEVTEHGSLTAVVAASMAEAARADFTDDTDTDNETQSGANATKVAAARIESLSVRELKDFITAAGLHHSDCVEKSDIIARAILAAGVTGVEPQHDEPEVNQCSTSDCSKSNSRQRAESAESSPELQNYYPKAEVGFHFVFSAMKALSLAFEVECGFWRNPSLRRPAMLYFAFGPGYRDSDINCLRAGLQLMGIDRFLTFYYLYMESRQIPQAEGSGEEAVESRTRRLNFSCFTFTNLLWIVSANFRAVNFLRLNGMPDKAHCLEALKVQVTHLLLANGRCLFSDIKKATKPSKDSGVTDDDLERVVLEVSEVHVSTGSSGGRANQSHTHTYSLKAELHDLYRPTYYNLTPTEHHQARQTIENEKHRNPKENRRTSFVDPLVAVQHCLQFSPLGKWTALQLVCHPLTLRALCSALGESLRPPPGTTDPLAEVIVDSTSSSVLLVVACVLNFIRLYIRDDDGSPSVSFNHGTLPSREALIDLVYRHDHGGITSMVGYLQGMLPALRVNVGNVSPSDTTYVKLWPQLPSASAACDNLFLCCALLYCVRPIQTAMDSSDLSASTYIQKYLFVSVRDFLQEIAERDHQLQRGDNLVSNIMFVYWLRSLLALSLTAFATSTLTKYFPRCCVVERGKHLSKM